jgi:hypothetical protein
VRRLLRFGARGGITVGLLAVIVAAVVVAKLIGGPAGAPFSLSGSPQPPVATSDGDDAEVAPASSFADDDAVLAAANAFAAAWLRRDAPSAEWHAGIAALATPALATRLDGVDPLTVPASRVEGPAVVGALDEHFATVLLHVDTGTLSLTLTWVDDRWLVDGVDWQRS